MQSRKSSLALVVALLSTLAVLLACGESSNVASVVSGTATPAKSTAPTHFKTGQQVKLGDYTVIVNSIKTTKGGEFDTLKAGHIFVVVDVSIKNISSKAQSFSSDLSFTFQDGTGQKYTQTFATDETPPDGTIPASGTLRGQLTYEAPTTQKKFTLIFQSDPFGTDQAVWDLSVA